MPAVRSDTQKIWLHIFQIDIEEVATLAAYNLDSVAFLRYIASALLGCLDGEVLDGRDGSRIDPSTTIRLTQGVSRYFFRPQCAGDGKSLVCCLRDEAELKERSHFRQTCALFFIKTSRTTFPQQPAGKATRGSQRESNSWSPAGTVLVAKFLPIVSTNFAI